MRDAPPILGEILMKDLGEFRRSLRKLKEHLGTFWGNAKNSNEIDGENGGNPEKSNEIYQKIMTDKYCGFS